MRGAAARRLATAALALAMPLPALTACTGPGADPAAGAAHDVLADLDRSVWSVTDTPTMLAVPVQSGTVDTAAWEAAGIDSASITATREAITEYLITAHFSPEALRGTDDAGDKRTVVASTPAVWTSKISGAWAPDTRYFYATEFAPSYRVIGRPHATMAWYLAERDGTRYVEAGGTIVYSVLEPETGATGVYALRFGIVAQPGASGAETPVAANTRVTVNGADICATGASAGLIVPAIDGSPAHETAQKATRDRVVADPEVPEEAIADPASALLAGDESTAVFCPGETTPPARS